MDALTREQLWLEAWDLIDTEAASVWRKYAQWAGREDIKQEMYTWALSHTEKVDEWLAEDPPRFASLGRALFRVGSKYAKDEKAHQSGYEPGDIFDYTPGVIANMLPEALGDIYGIRTQPPEVSARGGGKPANERGDFTIICMEIRWAFDRLNDDDQYALVQYYVNDMTFDELAPELGLRYASGAQRRVQSALRYMCRLLNDGAAQFTGSREVLSNAQAIARTERLT